MQGCGRVRVHYTCQACRAAEFPHTALPLRTTVHHTRSELLLYCCQQPHICWRRTFCPTIRSELLLHLYPQPQLCWRFMPWLQECQERTSQAQPTKCGGFSIYPPPLLSFAPVHRHKYPAVFPTPHQPRTFCPTSRSELLLQRGSAFSMPSGGAFLSASTPICMQQRAQVQRAA